MRIWAHKKKATAPNCSGARVMAIITKPRLDFRFILVFEAY